MINPLEILKNKERLEGLPVEPQLLQNYLKKQKGLLLKQARIQIETGGYEIFEESLKAYFVATLLSQNANERNTIIRQIIFHLRLRDVKSPEKVLKSYIWLDKNFENLLKEIIKMFELDDLVIKEEKVNSLDKEQNILKKDFEQLQFLTQEIIKDYSIPKYKSIAKRLEREKEAANKFKNLIEELEHARSINNTNNNQNDSTPFVFLYEELSEIINSKTKEIVELAPEYHDQVRVFLNDFIENVGRGKNETNIRYFENASNEYRQTIYNEFIGFLSSPDEKTSRDNACQVRIINSLTRKIQKFANTLEIFKEEQFIEEIKKGGHAWFQTAKLQFKRIKVIYSNSVQISNSSENLLNDLQQVIQEVEISHKIFETLVQDLTLRKSQLDIALIKDKEFLGNYLNELKYLAENMEKERSAENRQSDDSSNLRSTQTSFKKSMLNSVWSFLFSRNRRKQ